MRTIALTSMMAILGCVTTAGTQPQDPTWKEVDLPVEDAQLEALFFIDANEGWAVGRKGLILHTNDAGKTWEKQRGGDLNERLRDVFFIDNKIGWVVGGQMVEHGGDGFPAIVLKTEDGGSTWTQFDQLLKGTDAKSEFWYVRFKDNRGYVIGRPNSFISQNQGKTWGNLELKVVNEARMPTPTWVNEDTGFDIEGTTLFVTRNGGRTWNSEELTEFLPRKARLSGEFFLSEKIGFAVGSIDTIRGEDALIVKTEDGAKSWKVVSTIARKGFADTVFFADEKNGWIATHDHATEKDIILRTKDGGETWEVELEFGGPDTGHLGDLFFANGKTGFIPGPRILLRRGE